MLILQMSSLTAYSEVLIVCYRKNNNQSCLKRLRVVGTSHGIKEKIDQC